MQSVRRMLVWLARIGRCRGFGVQSPWAYRMVRYVINEHYPYYSYETLRCKYPDVDVISRKECELCLRLSNNVQPKIIVNIGSQEMLFGEYLKAGCRKARYVGMQEDVKPDSVQQALESAGGAVLIRIAPENNLAKLFNSACGSVTAGSVIMLHDIHADREARRLWKDITADLRGVVTFDLYYCGLVFFDDKRYKQNYIINF